MAADRPAASPWTEPAPAASEPSAAPGRVATLNAPSYYPPGYNAPVLGRVRPAAPLGASGPVSDADVSTAGRGRFVWPLRGAILSPFGDRGPGQRNDGLDISASPGESVRAAANGEVVYAGSSIPGFGNLVLVKHPGGWVTAYAHLDRIEVRMRDEVTQGEEIGQAGQTGAVDRPELHFEVRYAPDPAEKARPIDPTLVLPEAAKGSG
jgi:murein DD-endopeptidase MepM/ murein hydrolase activator NlpD